MIIKNGIKEKIEDLLLMIFILTLIITPMILLINWWFPTETPETKKEYLRNLFMEDCLQDTKRQHDYCDCVHNMIKDKLTTRDTVDASLSIFTRIDNKCGHLNK